MLRLAHRILSQTVFSPEYVNDEGIKTWTSIVEHAANRIVDSPVVMCGNVFEYLRSLDNPVFDYVSDVPCALPPFESMFIEFDCPRQWSPNALQLGWYVGSSSFASFKEHQAPPYLRKFLAEATIADSVRWAVTMTSFSTFEDGRVLSHGIPLLFLLDESFRIWRWKSINPYGAVAEETAENDRLNCQVPLLTIAFMHCKSVIRRDVTDAEGPAEKWLRRQKQPKLRYHVLQIDPMKEVLRRDGGAELNGLPKALHICRGHFVTYSEEKPLFGKYAGTFWVPQHIRGSSKHGVVVKDYNVKLNS